MLRSREFINHQVRELRKGGVTVARAKLFKLLQMAFWLPSAIIFSSTLVFLAGPLRLRLVVLDSSRIGEFVPRVDVFLAELRAGKHQSERYIFAMQWPQAPCNTVLERMLRRQPSFPLTRFTVLANLSDYMLRATRWADLCLGSLPKVDSEGLLMTAPCPISFSKREEDKGRRILKKLGLQPGQYVCWANRDSSYLRKTFPAGSWAYHDFRNSSLESFSGALEWLVQQGLAVVRMGAVVEEPLEVNNDLVIDYASSCRSELGDLYLVANCRFYLGDTSGLFFLANLFRRPFCLANVMHLAYLSELSNCNLFLCKMIWSRRENRLLTFEEMFGEIGTFCRSDEFSALGLETISNSSDEIRALVVEMERRVQGVWQENATDTDLQNRLRRIIDSVRDGNSIWKIKMGALFLKQYKALLD